MRSEFCIIFILACLCLNAQFAPAAGQPGSTAIFKDSSVFVNWASSCNLVRGYQDISDPSPGYASVGDSSSATGIAGANGIVSLGDGGAATLQFPFPIKNGVGYDFAVFENSFSDDYLELGFVEVSSDGINFFRFPATSNTQDTVQVGPFDLLDATKLNNLAGKYRMNYGTPFDLSDLPLAAGLDPDHITHVRIIDVIGSIDNSYATSDQYGNKINDPWPTPFPSSGFDLDAVGVINQNTEIGIPEHCLFNSLTFFCTDHQVLLKGETMEKSGFTARIIDVQGRKISEESFKFSAGQFFNFTLTLPGENGIYFITLVSENGARKTIKILNHG